MFNNRLILYTWPKSLAILEWSWTCSPNRIIRQNLNSATCWFTSITFNTGKILRKITKRRETRIQWWWQRPGSESKTGEVKIVSKVISGKTTKARSEQTVKANSNRGWFSWQWEGRMNMEGAFIGIIEQGATGWSGEISLVFVLANGASGSNS